MTTSTLHITNGKEELYLPLADIVFIENTQNYCDVYLTNNLKYKDIRITLKEFEAKINECGTFAEHHLISINRRVIINTSFINHIDPYGKQPKPGVPTVTLTEYDMVIDASKPRLKNLMSSLKKEDKSILLKSYGKQFEASVPINDTYEDLAVHNGHPYIDLGLPSGTLWATYNIGSKYPEDARQRFNRDDKDILEDSVFVKYQGVEHAPAPYIPTTDIAQNLWRGSWRMPTIEEFNELFNNCACVLCRASDQSFGFHFSGPNGNVLFLPADPNNRTIAQYWPADYRKDKMESCIYLREIDGSGEVDIHDIVRVKGELLAYIRPVLTKESIK